MFRWAVQNVAPYVYQAARDIVVDFEKPAFAYMTGQAKEAATVAALKAIAKREGDELRTNVAKAVVNGVLATVRNVADAPAEEIGEVDADDAPSELADADLD